MNESDHQSNPSSVGQTDRVAEKSRFCAAWAQHTTTAEPDQCERIFADLNQRYQEEGRHYHDRRHIYHCLKKLDEACAISTPTPSSKALIELAIWFHDAIYVAGEPDNESRSADWFKGLASGRLKPEAIRQIVRLIEVTEHRSLPAGELEQLMVDVDLSSFSLNKADFLADGVNIRQEFDQLSNDAFVSGQSLFLQALLDRPAIYSTRYFRERYEQQARSNIEELLAMYRQGFVPELRLPGAG